MSKEQTKTTSELNQKPESVNAFQDPNSDEFRQKWGDVTSPQTGYGHGYGYGYPYHHHHPHLYPYGYWHPYGYHHHHYGMYGPYYGHGMYGGQQFPYGMQPGYGGTATQYPYQRGPFDPAFFGFGADFPQQGFAGVPNTFPQAEVPNQSFQVQQPVPAHVATNVKNQVIQGTATPVRKPRANSNK
jgi:hypothetical protein